MGLKWLSTISPVLYNVNIFSRFAATLETGRVIRVAWLIIFLNQFKEVFQACAASVVVGGKVPIVITSKSDEAQARLASIAAAVVALD